MLAKILKNSALPAILISAILIPFALFGTHFGTYSAALLENVSQTAAAVIVVALLAGDVLLPIPSSLVSLVAGANLGLVAGTVVIWVGMTLGCSIGWAVGRGVFASIARVVENSDEGTPSVLTLILSRPIPVLAEMSILLAGARGLSFRTTLFVCCLTNLPIAAIYAFFGSRLLGEVPLWMLLSLVGVLALLKWVRRLRKSA